MIRRLSLPVSLREVIHSLELSRDSMHCFLDKAGGELVFVSNAVSLSLEPSAGEAGAPAEMPVDSAELETDKHAVELTESLRTGMRQVMASFCATLKNRAARDGLLERLHGHGDISSFEDGLYRYKVANEWFRFREDAINEFAVRWLDENGIPCTNDLE